MRQISIQELKASLSAAIAEAESGNTIVITRHNEAVAQLFPAHPRHVHRAKKTEAGPLKPALKRATKGRYLDILFEDRGDH
jgi:prevent-host-death family protein